MILSAKGMQLKYTPVEYDPFIGPEIEKVAPAIEPQMEVWVSCKIGGDDASRAYNESVSLDMSGQLEMDMLATALQAVVMRHEALRAVFSADGTKMIIYKEFPVNIIYDDLTGLSDAEQKECIKNNTLHNANTVFNLAKGPLFQFGLMKLNTDRHYFTITVHHIVCDGWSLGVLLQDIATIYNSLVEGQSPSLADAPSFAKYAVAQWQYAHSQANTVTESYWINLFSESVPVLDLPVDGNRPPVRTYKSRRDDYELSPHLVAGLKKVGVESGCSFVTTLLAAVEVYIQKVSRQPEIVIGLPAAGQSATGNIALVGHCVNLLPLRSAAKGQFTFSQYLAYRKEKIFDAYDNQLFTFGSLLKKINISRDPSRVPLVPVVLNLDMGLDKGVSFNKVSHKLISNPREFENFELFLNVTGSTESALVFEWSYNKVLFPADTIKRMMGELEGIITEITTHPELKIAEYSSLSPLPASNAILAGRTPAIAFNRDKTVVHLFSSIAEQNPDKVALLFNERSLTYKYLHEKSNKMAGFLQSVGVKHGDIVALAMDRTPDLIVALLSILKAGAAYLPIDIAIPAARRHYKLQDSGARYLFTSKDLGLKSDDKVTCIFFEDAWKRSLDFVQPAGIENITGSDLCYLIYTSGSTGRPKGVMVQHGNLTNFLHSIQNEPGVTAKDRVLAITSISFDISILEIFVPLISGAAIVLCDTEASKDGRLIVENIKKHQVTIAQATPSMWRIVLDAGMEKHGTLKVLSGGEPLKHDLANRLLEKCGGLWNMYGPTEATVWATLKKISKSDSVITIGKPLQNVHVYVLDEQRKPVPQGTQGLIFIGGECVTRGYVNNTKLTNEKFKDDPFAPGGKMYETGDYGKVMPGGDIVCLGRADAQLKIRGHRVEPGEIEHLLLQSWEIKEAVITANGDTLVAHIVPNEGITEVNTAWKEALKAELPSYMIPDQWLLVNKMPLSVGGKTDRNALAGKPQVVAQPQQLQALTATETAISNIWKELLGLKNIDKQSDFFDLGGHSMLAIQAITRLEKLTGKKLPVSALFQHPTIEKLAIAAEKGEVKVLSEALLPLKPSGNKPPLFIVHGYNMNVHSFAAVAKHMDGAQPVYGLQPKALNNPDAPFVTMEEIAAEYIQEVLAVNTTNSVALAGYSFGGYIAFEMARQLTAMGKQVKMLAMFDAYAHNEKEEDPAALKLKRKILRQFPKMLFITGSLLRQPIPTIKYQAEFVRSKLNAMLGGNAETHEEIALDPKIYERYEYAFRNYELKPYDGVIDVFKVNTRLYFLDDPKYLGWKDWAGKGVRVHNIPGDHKTFIMVPHNKEFANILQDALDSVKIA